MRRLSKLALLIIFLTGQANAQGLRDPTLPPAEAGLDSNAPAGKELAVQPGSMTIIVRDGRPYLAVGTRLYAQGEKIGQTRVERITETEVWLREGAVLRKVSQFQGIERHNAGVLSKSGAGRSSVPALNSKIEPDANKPKASPRD